MAAPRRPGGGGRRPGGEVLPPMPPIPIPPIPVPGPHRPPVPGAHSPVVPVVRSLDAIVADMRKIETGTWKNNLQLGRSRPVWSPLVTPQG